jgi:hypothetical protein
MNGVKPRGTSESYQGRFTDLALPHLCFREYVWGVLNLILKLIEINSAIMLGFIY